MADAVLNSDGGSRGNPGPAGIGFELKGPGNGIIAFGGWFIGQATNNVAEYSALIWGLQNAKAAGLRSVDVRADSELIVKQLLGSYKVKSEELKPLYLEAKALLAGFDQSSIAHVYREENGRADALANDAMDAMDAVGSYLVPWDIGGHDLFAAEGNAAVPSLGEPACTAGDAGPTMERNTPYTGPYELSGSTYEHQGGVYELTVKDHFDAAHSLPGYDGPCRYLHGHTWDVEATLAGARLDETGILFDFKAIKQILHGCLENFDHRYMNETPPFDAINPTAEHLARVLFFEIERHLPPSVSLKEVAVWESPQAKVAYRP